jgi:hypothetical protein
VLDLANDAKLRALAGGWQDRVRILTASCPGRPELTGLLVRPDGYVAWQASPASGPAGLDIALATWFGPAA